MEAPKCKICGDRHYGICSNHAGSFWDDNQNDDERAKSIPKTIADVIKRDQKTSNHTKRGGFDRCAYQRELMRKRRAAEKALKNKP